MEGGGAEGVEAAYIAHHPLATDLFDSHGHAITPQTDPLYNLIAIVPYIQLPLPCYLGRKLPKKGTEDVPGGVGGEDVGEGPEGEGEEGVGGGAEELVPKKHL